MTRLIYLCLRGLKVYKKEEEDNHLKEKVAYIWGVGDQRAKQWKKNLMKGTIKSMSNYIFFFLICKSC